MLINWRQAHRAAGFDEASPDPFSVVAEHAGVTPNAVHFEKNAEIYWERGPAEYAYQVVEGAVRNYKLLPDGRCQITAFYLPGDVFGYDGEETRRTSAEAIIDTNVRVVKRHLLEAAADTDIVVSRYLLDLATENLKHARQQIVLLGRKTAVERVTDFLLEMDERLTRARMLSLPMCRRDIGDYLGLTLETVSRVLAQLHGAGVIDFSGARQITLRDRSQLLGQETPAAPPTVWRSPPAGRHAPPAPR